MTQYLYLSSPENPQGWVVRPEMDEPSPLNYSPDEEGGSEYAEALYRHYDYLANLPRMVWHGSPMESGTVLVEGKDFEMKWQVNPYDWEEWVDCDKEAYDAMINGSRRQVAVPIAIAVTIKNENMSNEQKVAALKEAALPLIKYLAENHHPHVTVIVTATGAELVEGILHTSEVMDFVKY